MYSCSSVERVLRAWRASSLTLSEGSILTALVSWLGVSTRKTLKYSVKDKKSYSLGKHWRINYPKDPFPTTCKIK